MKKKKNMNDILCPYCNRKTKLVTGEYIYPYRKDLYENYYYICEPCDAYVGCDTVTLKPLGTLADIKLRRIRIKAHMKFDKLWKSGKMTRSEAYIWLADKMGIEMNKCHIKYFDIDECKWLIDICQNYFRM